jgi:two-component system sensor histidine kinase/response regulator
MSGDVATEAIRKLDNIPQPIIIALTANAMEGDRELCLKSGMNSYTSKPITLTKLQNVLAQTHNTFKSQ